MGCWHGCLSGARCRLAYVHIFNAIATHSVASGKSRLVLPFWYQLVWVVLEKGPLNGCVCTCHFFLTYLSPSLVIFPFENRPAPLDAVKKRLNLALVFVFILCCTFVLVDERMLQLLHSSILRNILRRAHDRKIFCDSARKLAYDISRRNFCAL